MPPKEKYTDPELRDKVKEDLKQSDKGGRPGQWSARKAQMMASEYKKQGGGYNEPKETGQDDSQKHLSQWGEEEWQTRNGDKDAKKEDGGRKRYLPKKAWEEMSEKEKDETEEKKQEGDEQGQQFVGNTDKAKKARGNANKDGKEKIEKKKNEEQDKGPEEQDDDDDDKVKDKPNGTTRHNQNDDNKEESKADEEVGEKEYSTRASQSTRTTRSSTKRDKEKADADQKTTPNKKQKTSKSDTGSKSSKKNETVGSKHDKADPPAAQGSSSRLPKKGKSVHWKAMPGWVKGEVVEILKNSKKVDGKDVKASKDDPRLVLKSASSGKICVHKPDNIYFDD